VGQYSSSTHSAWGGVQSRKDAGPPGLELGSVLDPTLWSDDMSSRGLQRDECHRYFGSAFFFSLLDWMPHLFFRVFILGWTTIGLGLKPTKHHIWAWFSTFPPQQIRLGFPAFFLRNSWARFHDTFFIVNYDPRYFYLFFYSFYYYFF
jgi:hypothetical protein